MARGRRSSCGTYRPAPTPAAKSPSPQRARQAPLLAPLQSNPGGSVLGSIGSTIGQGMAFGTGSAVAHRVVDYLVGPRTIHHEVVGNGSVDVASMNNSSVGSDACDIYNKAFQDCLNSSESDVSNCQFYLDMLNKCRRNIGSITGA